MVMLKLATLIALFSVISVSGSFGRTILQAAPAPAPYYAPAPLTQINGVTGYDCSSPGLSGYMFQPAPCAYGPYAGLSVYCDESTEGPGVIGIRDVEDGMCTATSDCETGYFCNVHFNATCTAVASTTCFSGAPAPAPALTPGVAITSTAAAPGPTAALSS